MRGLGVVLSLYCTVHARTVRGYSIFVGQNLATASESESCPYNQFENPIHPSLSVRVETNPKFPNSEHSELMKNRTPKFTISGTEPELLRPNTEV